MEFVVVGDIVVELNTWEDIEFARGLLADHGLVSAEVYSGESPDAVKTGQKIFL